MRVGVRVRVTIRIRVRVRILHTSRVRGSVLHVTITNTTVP